MDKTNLELIKCWLKVIFQMIYIILGGKIMERQDWEMSVEEFNDCGCAMNGD